MEEIDQAVDRPYDSLTYSEHEKEWVWYVDTYCEAMDIAKQLKRLTAIRITVYRHAGPELVA